MSALTRRRADVTVASACVAWKFNVQRSTITVLTTVRGTSQQCQSASVQLSDILTKLGGLSRIGRVRSTPCLLEGQHGNDPHETHTTPPPQEVGNTRPLDGQTSCTSPSDSSSQRQLWFYQFLYVSHNPLASRLAFSGILESRDSAPVNLPSRFVRTAYVSSTVSPRYSSRECCGCGTQREPHVIAWG
jgi:hypothetical protein